MKKTNAASANKPSCTVDIYFKLTDGIDWLKDDTPSSEASLSVPISNGPEITRKHKDRISTYEALTAPKELVNYYRQLISIANEHGIPFDDISHKFWIELVIGCIGTDQTISFDYYDHLTDIVKFIDWIVAGAPNAFSDRAQGWEIVANRTEDIVNIIQNDPECSMELSRIEVPFVELKEKAVETLHSAKSMIEYLSDGLGDDVWTEYSRVLIMMGHREEIRFGTEDWTP